MSLLLPPTLQAAASRKLPPSTFPDLHTPSTSPSISSRSTALSPLLISSSYTRSRASKRHGSSYSAFKLITMAHSVEAVAASSAEGLDKDFIDSRTFLTLRSEEELLAKIKRESGFGRLPSALSSTMQDLWDGYRNAVLRSGIDDADAIVVSNMAALFDRILSDAEDPFFFPPYHKAMREPFDYYMFGQNYIHPLIDFKKSYIGNINIFGAIEADIEQGHNAILISNHQTEADPAIIALLLEKFYPRIAEEMTYVAGDRVLTDLICKPFSMGRNLICVYSKKHMFDDPATSGMKKAANIRSLKEMAALLRNGSQVMWIAPSGGRDRPNRESGEWHPASFDPSSMDNMRRIAEHAGPITHFYPLALLCYNIMPPPQELEKEIGERRVVGFHGVGLSVAPEINYHAVPSATENPEEAKDAYSKAMHDSVSEQYDVLKSAIHGGRAFEAATPRVCLSQPW